MIPRKDKLTFLPKNLKYLRGIKGSTLEQMARELSLAGKTSYLAYEEGRALPDIFKLMKLATYFNISLDDLMHKDIANANTDSSDNVETNEYEIELVPFSAAAGYARGFADFEYIKELKKIKIPYKPYGIARAFSIVGDSMEPTISNGATVIAIKINPGEIRDDKPYIVVTNEGLQCKKLSVGENDFVYLISANPKHKLKHVEKEKILEIWEVWKTM